ncbi:MAG: F0F1 ATP synthase subunit A [Mycoplasmatales bacterium]|nr:F0F1 ATP synthase subunit A [Mycoplasmatales bacterium]
MGNNLIELTANKAALSTAAETVTKNSNDNFLDKFLQSTLQPQIFSTLLVTLILIIFSIVVYRKVKKQKVNEAPDGVLLFAEQYVVGVDNLFKDVTEEKISKPGPYIFTLLTFLSLGNLMGLIGLEPPSTSYSTTLTLGLISWIGIYVVGLMYKKFRFFKKYLNPVEWIGQFAPLISISFRIFGNMIGGSTVIYLLYYFTGWIWSFIPVVGELNLLSSTFMFAFHLYFDLFDGLIQAFVFSLLTMVYWTLEAEVPVKKVKLTKEEKEAKKADKKLLKKDKIVISK